MTPSITTSFLVLALATLGSAQQALSPADLVAQAQAASPAVAAGRLQVRAAEANARSISSPASPVLEVAPGVGFTNSNVLLGQSFDLSGVRAARAQAARAEVLLAKAALLELQTRVATDVLSASATYQGALQGEANARIEIEFAKATVQAVGQRVTIGEAPAVQLTRAELELLRAEQALVLARRDLTVARASVNSLLARPGTSDLPVIQPLALGTLDALVDGVLDRRHESWEASAHLEVARAEALEARRSGLPSLTAGLVADTWSFDRRPFNGNNLGFQVTLSMPLFDRGERRHAVRSSDDTYASREADLKEAHRRIALDVETAASSLQAARAVAATYQAGMLPRAEQMVKAMQAGLVSGITGFLEVLEAQRTLAAVRREATDASLNLQLAEVRFLAATAHLPGLEVRS